MSKHEELRRELQFIRDRLLALNKAWFELVDTDAIEAAPENKSGCYCPGDISMVVHDLTQWVKHDESAIEKLLKQRGK